MSYESVISASDPYIWWKLDSAVGTTASNYGALSDLTGTIAGTGNRNSFVSGAATSSNYAWNPYTGQTISYNVLETTGTGRIESAVSAVLSQTINPLNPSSSFTFEILWRQYGANAQTTLFGWISITSPYYGWAAYVDTVTANRLGFYNSFISSSTPRTVSYFATKAEPGCELPILNGSNTGSWHHIVFIQNRADTSGFSNSSFPFEFYFDGCRFDYSSNDSANSNFYSYANPASATLASSDQRLLIGRHSAMSSNGMYQQLAVYTRSLSYDEIQSHYAQARIYATGTSGSWDLSGSTTHETIQAPGQSLSTASTGSGGGQDPRASKLNQGIN